MADPETVTREFWLKSDRDGTFVPVSHTFKRGATIFSIIEDLVGPRWNIPKVQLGNVKMYLVPWPLKGHPWPAAGHPGEAKDHPLANRHPVVNPLYDNLIALHDMSVMGIEDSLADEELLKAWTPPGSATGAQDISAMFLEGLVSGARIVVVLPK